MPGDKIGPGSLRHLFNEHGIDFQGEWKSAMSEIDGNRDLDRARAHNATLDPAMFAAPKEEPKAAQSGVQIAPPPGLAGTAVQWLEAGNHVPNIQASIASVLGVSAAVCGRAYYNDSPQGADGINLYLCLLAPSGGGKEWMWGGIRRMISEAGLSAHAGKIMGGQPVSGTALAERIEDAPSTLIPLPEVGKWLQQILHRNSNGAEKSLQKELLSLYSMSSPYSVYSGVAKAGRQGTRPVQHPAVSIIGESTHSSLWDALSDESVRSGLVSRLTVLDAGTTPGEDRYTASAGTCPVAVLDSLLSMGSRWTVETPTRIPVRWSDAARDMDRECFASWSAEKQSGTDDVREVISRQRQNAPRIAANLALWDNPLEPVVSAEHIAWAWMVVDSGCQTILGAFRAGEISGSASTSLDDVLASLARERADKNGFVARSTLQNYAKRRPLFRESLKNGGNQYTQALRETIRSLEESGVLTLAGESDRPDGMIGRVYYVAR